MEAPVVATETWVRADWESFVRLTEMPAFEWAKCYYDNGWMRIEMSLVSPAHARDNGLIAQLVGVFALSRRLTTQVYIAPSLRLSGLAEAQPDLAFYIHQPVTPARSTKPIDLATTPPPALVVEIAATTLEDDLTTKRELYAQMGIEEYWVVDALNARVNLFARPEAAQALVPIAASQVLTGLSVTVLEAALQLGASEGDTAAMQLILDLPEASDR